MAYDDRLDNLIRANSAKIDRLSDTNKESLSDSVTDMGDGYVEHNGNKIWGIGENWSKEQNAFARDYVVSNFSNKQGNPNSKRMYDYGTSDVSRYLSPEATRQVPDFDPHKIGLSRGDFDTSDARYVPTVDSRGRPTGWLPGSHGVDVNRKHSDVLLNRDAAAALEGILHTNKHALDSRLIRKRSDGMYDYLSPEGLKVISKEEKDSMYGSGSSEYYSNRNNLFNNNYSLTDEQQQEVISGINKAMELVSSKRGLPDTGFLRLSDDQIKESVNKTTANEAGNTVKGFLATVVSEALVNPADAAVEFFSGGLLDLGTSEEKSEAVNSFFGYSDYNQKKAMEKIGQHFDVLTDSNASTGDRVRAAFNGVAEAFTSPDMFATSIGTIAAWAAPGALLSKLGHGTKYAAKIAEINKKVAAGKLPEAEAKGRRFAALMSVDGAKAALVNQSGMITAAAGNVNDQYEEFIELNGGKGLEGADFASWVSSRILLQMVNQNVDKFIDLSILKSPGAIKSIAPAMQALSNKEFLKVFKAMAYGASKKGALAGAEGGQEYLQTSMELFNSRYGSETFKDLDTYSKFLFSDDIVRESGIAALAGVGGAGQFEAAGGLVQLVSKANGAVVWASDAVKRKTEDNPQTAETSEEVSEETADNFDIDNKLAVEVINRVYENHYKVGDDKNQYFDNTTVNSSNISSLLDDIDTINRTRYTSEKSSPEGKANREMVEKDLLKGITTFIETSGDLRLKSRLVKVTKPSKEPRRLYPVTIEQAKPFVDFYKLNGYNTVEENKAVEGVLKTFASSTYEQYVSNVDEDVVFDSVVALEKSLTGTSSDTLKSSFNNIKNHIEKSFPNFKNNPPIIAISLEDLPDEYYEDEPEKVKPVDENESTVLGSEPADKPSPKDEYVEVEYTDLERRAEVRRIIRTVLGSEEGKKGKFDPRLEVLGEANGLTKDYVKSYIKKTRESVEVEATTGDRGYITYLENVEDLTAATNPDVKKIKEERLKVSSMYDSISSSVEQLKRGIAGAKAKANELSKTKLASKKTVQFKTEYVKSDKKNFVINVMYKDGKWVPQIKEAEQNIEDKERYLSDIRSRFSKINSESGFSVKQMSEMAFGNKSLIIPVSAGKLESLRAKDKKYLERSISVIDKIVPNNSGFTGVILGQETHDKWRPKGDYRKANQLLINRTEYGNNEVVLIDSTKVVPTADGKYEKADLGSEAKKSLKAAMESGATIVLDSALTTGLQASKQKNLRTQIERLFTKDSGYIQLPGSGSHIFAKATDKVLEEVAKQEKTLLDEQSKKDKADNLKDKAVSLKRAITLGKKVEEKGSGVRVVDASKRDLVEMEDEYATVSKELVELGQFKSEDKVDAYTDRRAYSDVSDIALEQLNSPNPSPLAIEDPILLEAVEAYIENENNKDSVGEKVLSGISAIYEKDLPNREREKSVGKLIKETTSLTPRALVKDVLGERSYTKEKGYLYEYVYEIPSTGEIRHIPRTKNPTDEEFKALMEKNDTKKGHPIWGRKGILLDVRRVSQDAGSLVNVNKTTVLNSLPVDYLPQPVRAAVDLFTKGSVSVLKELQEGDLIPDTFPTNKAGIYNLHNSPARGIIFNKNGEINPEVMAAAYLALGDLLVSDKGKLTVGYKADNEIASMFGIQEFEITKEMRDFAYNNGALMKTVADKLGKGVLAQLGLSKKVDESVSAYEYNSLVADIGNTILLVAKESGLIKDKSYKSNDLAEFYREGEKHKIETQTWFVQLPGVQDKNSKFAKENPTKYVEGFISNYEEVAKLIPESSTTRKRWNNTPPDSDRLDKALNEVRNDVSGKTVPESGKEALKVLMNTPYTPQVKQIKEFLDLVANPDYNIMEQLGYVEIDSDKFKDMYFRDKEVQEAKNRDIEASIKHLEDLVEGRSDNDSKIYFDYFYASNDRYMLDSNTINPQTDKLHRFFVVPSAHKLDYEVGTNSSGAATFKVGNKDMSFMVRMALAQAFGKGVDKMYLSDIAENGDVLLSLSLDQIEEVRESLLKTGKASVYVNGKPYKFEAEHISHTLQAIEFLVNAKSGKPFSSSLSMEFDSLTSGFANKVQQMPILDNMDWHFARVGLITSNFASTLSSATNFIDADTSFDPAHHTISDLLAMGGEGSQGKAGAIDFLDSYKNMANDTISVLKSESIIEDNLSYTNTKGALTGRLVFETIKDLLPGSNMLGADNIATSIDSSLRSLFKNPFMIFNYSASISRIIKNLSYDVSHDIAKGMATADLSKSENVKHVMDNLVDIFKRTGLEYSDDKRTIDVRTAEDLQEVLKIGRLRNIKLGSPLVVQSDTYQKEKSKATAKNLEQVLELVVSATYGEAVEKVFKKNFGPFIEVQNAMNDTYKVAFRVFDKMRTDMLNTRLKSNPDRFLTVKDHAEVLGELWEQFPWIVGPLTKTENGQPKNKNDVITVVTNTAKTLDFTNESRKKPQALLKGVKGSKTRTVTPIVRYLEEAVSAGSVLPFHAIDGAEIVNAIMSASVDGEGSIAAIHDAIITPLNKAEETSYRYNKGMYDINSTYSLADAMRGLTGRLEKLIDDNFDKAYKDLSVKGLKTAEKDKELKFPEALKRVISEMNRQSDKITTARNNYYGDNGILNNVVVGNLVGVPSGSYVQGQKEPDFSKDPDFVLDYADKYISYDNVKLDAEDKADILDSKTYKALSKLMEEVPDYEEDSLASDTETTKKTSKDNTGDCK